MLSNDKSNGKNPLGTEKVGVLLRKFAVPSIIAMLVGALYNIIDQLFIGNKIGELGNAATNIAFPLSISCVAIALLFGIGGASAFNLSMGKGEKEEAAYYFGNALSMLVICGIVLGALSEIFLTPLLKFFGSPANVLGYAKEYTAITAVGFPFVILATGGGHLIRADGSPKMTMICNLTGAVINTILDALFVLIFQWGMAGAAWATIIGQLVSAVIVIMYVRHCKTIELKKDHLVLRRKYVKKVASLGTAPCSNQLAMMVVQIVMNKSLKYYGSMSVYGESIPIACSGIISKVNMIFFSFIIGISQGLQPIVSFNYGAGKEDRVKKGYMLAIKCGGMLAVVAFIMFQVFPRQIIGIFGSGSSLYYKFAISYFRIFLLITPLNFLQPITANFFTAIGKPIKGVYLSLTRQIIYLLPLMVILPLITGIDGVLYSGPVADAMAAITAVVMVRSELKNMK